MTRPLSHAVPPPAFAWPRVAATFAAAMFVTTPAFPQGTAEQREACTEDAIRLCPDAIPDVDKTTVCMKAHEAQLSRRCHRVFAAETDAPLPRADERPRRTARAPRAAEDDLDGSGRYDRRAYEYDAPRGVAPGPEQGSYEPRRLGPGPDEDYDDRPRRVGPDESYDAPRRAAPGADEDYYDRPPRRVERVEPNPYEDGYGPRRYLYSTPQGTTETPY